MKTIVFTFGRMNPPTKGHEKLIRKVVETARSIGGDHKVFISQTQNDTTDPLEWNFKIRVCEAAHKGVSFSKDAKIRSPFHALESFVGKYDKAILVVGSDQVNEFALRMAPYAAKQGLEFEIVSAGTRINESDDIEGISGTKMREYALTGNRDKFYAFLPSGLNEQIRKMVYTNTKKGIKSQ